MEGAIKTVVSVFLKFAKGKENLGGKEFQTLVEKQLNNIMTDAENSKAVTKMRQGLDENKDGKISFQEYMILVGELAQQYSHQCCSENESGVEVSVQETQAEAPAAAKAEAEVVVVAEPVKDEVVAVVVKDEAEPKVEAEEEEEEEAKEEGAAEAEKTS
ncbi:S100 calcium binding protein U [Astyanax mexicanus]|uniref:S100 calcium binding protein U n=1 Tax=Astyanax mexicanus TaxID=7994 RepID=UPI0020CB2944|nr:S100 calcium binding protein U [Astyanax mexicanus]